MEGRPPPVFLGFVGRNQKTTAVRLTLAKGKITVGNIMHYE